MYMYVYDDHKVNCQIKIASTIFLEFYPSLIVPVPGAQCTYEHRSAVTLDNYSEFGKDRQIKNLPNRVLHACLGLSLSS